MSISTGQHKQYDYSYIESFDKEVKLIQHYHAKQLRKFSWAPYWTHPIRVATLVMKYKDSHEIDNLVRAALFHDLIEDTTCTNETLLKSYDPLVSSLVLELTNDAAEIAKIGKSKYMQNKIVGLSSWGLVIKLCDRLDNISDFLYAPKPFIDRYSRETWNMMAALKIGYTTKDAEGNTISKLSNTHREIMDLIVKTLIFYQNM